jgi:DNA-directed RNA polymerase specialized sigma24 family protein
LAALDGALDSLPAAQREALALRYLRGLSRAEAFAELVQWLTSRSTPSSRPCGG